MQNTHILDKTPPFNIKNSTHFPRCWAGLAVLSLIFSGLAPLLLIAGRASIYAEMEFVKEWFVPVLVVHVNLSVGLWFLALCAMCWSYLIEERHKWLQKLSLFLFGVAIILMACSPLYGGDAYTSNYIPVQNNILFFSGLALVTASLIAMLAGVLLSESDSSSLYVFMIKINALTVLVALSCFYLSWLQHPSGYGGESFYEAIFWGGGHILQIAYVQLAIIAWLWISYRLAIKRLADVFVRGIFKILWLAVALTPLVYFFADVNSYYHIKFFSWQMNSVTGTLPAIILLSVLFGLCKVSWKAHLPASLCLFMSAFLFFEGGLLGFIIEGSNVIIPAHYHGSTVGVTLALMGLLYLLLPSFGVASVAKQKLAIAQPIIYGVGQIMHATGLALAGGHGVARKTAGALDESQIAAEAALQVMRIGGLLAVIGGALFIVVMIRAYVGVKKSAPATSP